jgi:hypothetical protein
MRIGVDLDGILADFTDAFRQLALFHYNIDIGEVPHSWDWWQQHLSKQQFAALWHQIEAHPEWWTSLKPMQDAPQGFHALHSWRIHHGADVYIITSRPGKRIQYFSQKWVNKWALDPIPVLIAKDAHAKGVLATGLRLTHFVDDKPENVEAVALHCPQARAVLLDRPWNHGADLLRITKLEELV